MKLSLEQIQSVTVGALQIRSEADGIHFCKMSAAQMEAYGAINEAQRTNALATTGVRLDFHTDAAYVKYMPVHDGRYEVKIDGLLIDDTRAVGGTELVISLPADTQEHRVTLHLPSHGTPGVLSYVELPDGAALTPHRFDRKMLFIGDSITQGWNSGIDTLSYAYLVSDHFNAESIIQGVGSACYNPTTLSPIDFDPDTVIVAYGTNDAGKETLEQIEGDCRAYLEKLVTLFPRERIRVITPIPRLNRDEIRTYGPISLVGKTVRAVAESLFLAVIDGEKMVPSLPAMMADNVHPNAIGFSVYAHNLIKALSE
jgi:lysophospholipase L1-like esterase